VVTAPAKALKWPLFRFLVDEARFPPAADRRNRVPQRATPPRQAQPGALVNATRVAAADVAQDSAACAALASEAGELRKVLVRQLGALSAAGDGELPVLRDHLWLSQADITRSSQTLGPMLKKARKELEKLLEVRVVLHSGHVGRLSILTAKLTKLVLPPESGATGSD